LICELRKILKIIGGGRRFLALIILRSPISIAMTLVNAYFLQQAFNAISDYNKTNLVAACAIFIVASLCTFLYNGFIWSSYAAPLVIKMEGILRVKLFTKISTLSYEKIESHPQGEWLTRLNTDVQMPFSEAWVHTGIAFVNIAISSLLLCFMNITIFGWIVLFIVPHIIFSQVIVARVMPGLIKNSLEMKAKNTNEFNALIICSDIAMIYDSHDYFMKRFEKSSMDLFRASMKKHVRTALGEGVLPLFGLGGYFVLLIVSSRWIADGIFTFGDLTAAFQLRGSVLSGSLMLINSIITIQASMAGIRRLNETMSDESEVV